MKHIHYEITYTNLSNQRTSMETNYTKQKALSVAKKLKEEGMTEIIIDKYAPNIDFEGAPDYDDIVWVDYMSFNDDNKKGVLTRL